MLRRLTYQAQQRIGTDGHIQLRRMTRTGLATQNQSDLALQFCEAFRAPGAHPDDTR
jgi:hypothetical protein